MDHSGEYLGECAHLLTQLKRILFHWFCREREVLRRAGVAMRVCSPVARRQLNLQSVAPLRARCSTQGGFPSPTGRATQVQGRGELKRMVSSRTGLLA